jgi:HAD superfamily hydrolase (TIGR01549 family)
MSSPIRAWVFDLDGTLIDSMPLVLRAYAHALEPFHPPLTEDALRARLGGPPEKVFEQLLNDSSHVTGALRRLEGFGAENWQLIEPFSGMNDLLRDAAAAGVRLAVWTGRERESTTWLLRKHGIAEYLATFLCGDDLPSHKPDPAGLIAVLERLGVTRDDAVFVGDAEVDLMAGAEVDVRTMLITHGLEVNPALQGRAWRIVRNPAEAYSFLRIETAISASYGPMNTGRAAREQT